MEKLSNEILQFWFSPENTPKWFIKSDDFDNNIKDRFMSAYNDICDNKTTLPSTPKEYLASIILLDQFPRNMFRNTPKSFATDSKAINTAKEAIKKNAVSELKTDETAFLYMPFMHSEDIEEQKTSVKLYEELGNEENLKFAIAHKDIIEKFGRFPHRNNILGRQSTEEEIEFLKLEGSSF